MIFYKLKCLNFQYHFLGGFITIYFQSKSTQVFNFTRGLFVIYGTFPKLIQRKHRTKPREANVEARAPKRLLFECYFFGEIIIEKKEMHQQKDPNLR